mmetsp:Transcript_11948/g.32745  ORF Transcript_11948/g.32745 Transcript_11948/m.32745 type:complete len:274 (+) Transcript_11948:393-1214(+)
MTFLPSISLHRLLKGCLVDHASSVCARPDSSGRVARVLQHRNGAPAHRLPDDLLRRDNAAVRQAHRLPALQLPEQGAACWHPQLQRLCRVERPGPVGLGEYVAPIRQRVDQGHCLQSDPSMHTQWHRHSPGAPLRSKALLPRSEARWPDEVLTARNPAIRDLKVLQFEALLRIPASRAPQNRLHHAPQALRAHEEERLPAPLHGYRVEQSKDAETVVPMEVGQQHGRDSRGPENAAHTDVVLRALPAVNQDGSPGTQDDRQAGHVAPPRNRNR